MASDRSLWKEEYLDGIFPPFPCPHCRRGNLLLKQETMQKFLPAYYEQDRRIVAWDPDWDTYRFSCVLICTVPSCGEVVAMGGNITRTRRAGEEDWEWPEWYAPKFMHPGSPLTVIPDDTPTEVEEALKLSFALFWVDAASCAAKLRLSVERVLDHLGVPTGQLGSRIRSLKASHPEDAEIFDALRHVGNVGVHQGDVGREELLDAYEIYQDQLADMFGGRRTRLKNLVERLITSKGRYELKKDNKKF